jgi:hypothetical protein
MKPTIKKYDYKDFANWSFSPARAGAIILRGICLGSFWLENASKWFLGLPFKNSNDPTESSHTRFTGKLRLIRDKVENTVTHRILPPVILLTSMPKHFHKTCFISLNTPVVYQQGRKGYGEH